MFVQTKLRLFNFFLVLGESNVGCFENFNHKVWCFKNHRPNPKCSVKAQAIKTRQTARAPLYINFLSYVNVLPEVFSCFLFH